MVATENLIHGDCLEVLPTLDDKSIDLVLADPPYGTTACTWDSIIPLKPLWEQLKRIARGAIVLNASQPFTTTLISSNREMFKYCWVWEKNCPSNIGCANYQPMRYTEEIVVFYTKNLTFNKQMIPRSETGKKVLREIQKRGTFIKVISSDVSNSTDAEVDPQKYDVNFKNPSNIIFFNRVRGKVKVHQTQKPVAIMEYLIRTYTNENETVLDFCMGSGTTGVACRNLNRKFIGIERNREYFKIAQERIGSN